MMTSFENPENSSKLPMLISMVLITWFDMITYDYYKWITSADLHQ